MNYVESSELSEKYWSFSSYEDREKLLMDMCALSVDVSYLIIKCEKLNDKSIDIVHFEFFDDKEYILVCQDFHLDKLVSCIQSMVTSLDRDFLRKYKANLIYKKNFEYSLAVIENMDLLPYEQLFNKYESYVNEIEVIKRKIYEIFLHECKLTDDTLNEELVSKNILRACRKFYGTRLKNHVV